MPKFETKPEEALKQGSYPDDEITKNDLKKMFDENEPTPEELEEMFKAEEEEFNTGSIEEDYQDNSLLMHCKPVFNFQSIEFDIVVNPNDPESMEYMKGVYSQVLNCLMAVAVEQPNQPGAKKEPPLEDRPTVKMIEIMDKYGINYDKYTTKKQAQALIEKSLKG